MNKEEIGSLYGFINEVAERNDTSVSELLSSLKEMDDKGKRVLKLTNSPISDELSDILTRLDNYESVDIGEINDTKEISFARTIINDAKQTDMLVGREEMQQHIRDEMLSTGSAVVDESGNVSYNGVVKKESRLDIVIGLPASGKSSAIADSLSEEFKSRIIDNDEAKKMLPEYNNGWGADIVHKESQRISNDAFMESVLNGENIVLPKVGSDAKKLNNKYLAVAKSYGYEIYVHYVDLDRNKALGRMLNRFIETGRFLNPDLIEKYAPAGKENKISIAYDELKNGGMIDGYSKWDNDVKRGERPILIETSCEGEFIRTARRNNDRTVSVHGNDRFSSGGDRGSGSTLDGLLVETYERDKSVGERPEKQGNRYSVQSETHREHNGHERAGGSSNTGREAGALLNGKEPADKRGFQADFKDVYIGGIPTDHPAYPISQIKEEAAFISGVEMAIDYGEVLDDANYEKFTNLRNDVERYPLLLNVYGTDLFPEIPLGTYKFKDAADIDFSMLSRGQELLDANSTYEIIERTGGEVVSNGTISYGKVSEQELKALKADCIKHSVEIEGLFLAIPKTNQEIARKTANILFKYDSLYNADNISLDDLSNDITNRIDEAEAKNDISSLNSISDALKSVDIPENSYDQFICDACLDAVDTKIVSIEIKDELARSEHQEINSSLQKEAQTHDQSEVELRNAQKDVLKDDGDLYSRRDRNPLVKVEEAEEQNYNMIDGVINNVEKPQKADEKKQPQKQESLKDLIARKKVEAKEKNEARHETKEHNYDKSNDTR